MSTTSEEIIIIEEDEEEDSRDPSMLEQSQRLDRVQILQHTPNDSKFTDPNRQTETEEYEYIYEEEEEEDNPDGASMSYQPKHFGFQVQSPALANQDVEQTQIEAFNMESTPIERFDPVQRKPNLIKQIDEFDDLEILEDIWTPAATWAAVKSKVGNSYIQ